MFTTEGHYQGEPASITWDDGDVSGDAAAVAGLKRMAEEQEVVQVVGMGYVSHRDHLKNPLAALVLISKILYPITGGTGDVPEFPEVPPGAVV